MARVAYITRDIERALGKKPEGDYFIITNKTPYSEELKTKYKENIILIDSEKILDTLEILQSKASQEFLSEKETQIMVFKNTIHIEDFCKENNYSLLNPSAELSEKVENKITQIKWLGELESLLPIHKVSIVKDIEWNDKAFVLQWSHGHTGDGTLLIQNEKELENLKEKFPFRETKTTDFIKGPMFTANIVVTNKDILIGNISYQITGILPFTENAFSTIGNDWSLTHTILSESQLKDFEKIAKQLGNKMKESGWFGLFGIDVILDEERNEFNLIEINARQPASTTYESELQNKFKTSENDANIFEAHFNALNKISNNNKVIQINDGAQILQRVTKNSSKIDANKIVQAGYKVIKYNNDKLNADFIRIQSEKGIMESHNKFNKRGKEILELIS